jgi:hypothetical protein
MGINPNNKITIIIRMLFAVTLFQQFTIITQGGIATGEDRTIQRNIAEDSGIRKVAKKTWAFDANKER